MDRLNGTEAKSRRESFENLKHNCMAIGLWINNEDITMNLEQLKAMNTKDLTALYNEYAAKQVKRMESRAKLEERAAQLLRENGKLTEGAADAVSSAVPAVKGKAKSSPPKPPIEAPIEGESEMADKKATKKATKAPAKKAAAAKPEKAAGKRGAPLTDHTYKAISETSKKFNPNSNKLQASSARGVLYDAIKAKPNGLTRTKLQEQFPDQNVKSALDVLIKFGFVEVA